MKNMKLLYSTALIVMICAAAAGAMILAFAYNTAFDADIGHFKVGAALPIIGYVLAVLACIFAVIAVVLLKRDADADYTLPHSSALKVYSVLLGVFFVIAAVIDFVQTEARATAFQKLLPIFALLAAIYFFAPLFGCKTPKWVEGLLSALPLLWATLALITLYYDHHAGINNPIKISLILACALVMCYFVGESRFAIKSQHPFLFLGVGFVSLVLISVLSIPSVLQISAAPERFPLSPLFTVQLFCVAVFIALRLISLIPQIKNKSE